MITKEVVDSFCRELTKQTGLDCILYDNIGRVFDDKYLIVDIFGIEQSRNQDHEYIVYYNLHIKTSQFDDDIDKIDRLFNRLKVANFYIERNIADFGFSTWKMSNLAAVVRRIVQGQEIKSIEVEFNYGN